MALRRPVVIGLWALAAFGALATLSITQNVLYALDHGQRIQIGDIAYGAIDWTACALFTPVLVWLAYRLPLDRHSWRRNVPLVVLITFGCVMGKFLFEVPIMHALVPASVTRMTFRRMVTGSTVSVLIVYWGFIGVMHAVERQRIASQLRAQLTMAQLEALKGQLHPHFLFNTLNGIATLMHRDVDAADRMLTQLADLLRVTLHVPGTQEIALSEEMALIDRYLSIVRARFGDRLTVVCDVETAAADALVPHFLLQPLVENALEHGIARRPGPGRLEIRAKRDGEQLRISVSDDGLGLEASGGNGNGVGLANTRSRLEQLYGAAHALRLEPAAPCGVCATVLLPFHVRT